MNKIRNFCIIAHIDHGKSTLADRMLELTGTVEARDMKHGQLLDTMDIEQERGITIKLVPVRMDWKEHILNLIDTPGHVDFSYEVSRSLAACEGAILVVDATQGIEAQTLANTYLALEHNLEVIPVLNKIDLPSADVDLRSKEISNLLGIDPSEILAISAKEGTNVDKLLDQIIEKLPPPRSITELNKRDNNSPPDKGETGESPKGDHQRGSGVGGASDQSQSSTTASEFSQTRALIFDSNYDPYRGVVSYIRVMEGEVKKGDKLTFLSNHKQIDALEVGFFKPTYSPSESIKEGEVGYVVTGLKKVGDASVGDTLWKKGKNVTEVKDAKLLPGYKKVTPFVFASIFTTEADDYPELRDSLEKLSLNDSSLVYEAERSSALGFGFRCGFLGLLHMEIVQERLEREYDLDLIVTAPSVNYKLIMNDGTIIDIANPADLPKREMIQEIQEPFVKIEVLTPSEYIGSIMELCTKKRGNYKDMQHLEGERALIHFEIPLASIVVDFYDRLKSISSGYASLSYEFLDYRTEDLVKMDILVAGDVVPPLSLMLHKTEAQNAGSAIVKQLKNVIPKANFVIALQAAVGSQIIARENISAMRKDVTAKLYGGDVTRKRKLLEKQKKGKKRMKAMGKVNIPQEAFLSILKRGD